MGLKSATPFRFMLRLVKTLKVSKTLSKTGMVEDVTIQSWTELTLSLKFSY